jgi:putative two-component system response regulator
MSSNLLTPPGPKSGTTDFAVAASCDVAPLAPQVGPVPPLVHENTARILVVDDDPRSARLLSACLAAIGHRVTLAASAEEAIEAIGAERPDLILCDICLPAMDGIELTRRLRSGEMAREVPIVMVTSMDDRKVLTRSLEAGADDVLSKPVNAVELRTRVRSLLRNKVLADELRARERAALSFVPVNEGEILSNPAGAEADTQPGSYGPAVATILVVEDDKQECRLMEAYLGSDDRHLEIVHTVDSALAFLERESPDLVVLDLVLPGQTGYELIERMRQVPRHAHTPILVVSALVDVQDRVRALELGADDFILKGSDRAELQARARRLLRSKRSLDQLSQRCNHALRQAVTDGLTGLYTHGFMQDTLQRQAACSRRYEWPLSLLFVDIDHFKQINDRHGHAVGDAVLRSVGQVIARCSREGDTAVRYGGEEFVLLLPHTSRVQAKTLAERIRVAAETVAISCPQLPQHEGLRITVSIGISGMPEDANDAATLLQHADEAMYQAKRAGRNQITVFGEYEVCSRAIGRILLVDDDDRNLRLLEAYLTPEGYSLLKTNSGAEAIEIARREKPDLVLLDGMMPQMSGFDVCRRLKQENGTSLIPVVLVTALNSREDRLRGIEAGADDFLTKPLDRVELLARTRALLRAKRGTDSLEDAETVIFALAKAVESRDSSTGGHVERVSHYAVALGRALGLPDSQIAALRRAGFVHDIGKISIPDAILLKPGKLTPEERKIMQTHVDIGYEMLRPMRTFLECLPGVRFHHERLDGSGYPLGLRGDQIPVMAQIMAIVDVFDALTTDRVYRKAMSYDEALVILRTESEQGMHDPQLLEVFAQLVRGGDC